MRHRFRRVAKEIVLLLSHCGLSESLSLFAGTSGAAFCGRDRTGKVAIAGTVTGAASDFGHGLSWPAEGTDTPA
jgi:hypothetical protein